MIDPDDGYAIVTWSETALRLGIAALSGAAIGWEREAKSRPAGLRTHILVATGACVLALVALDLSETLGDTTDPARIVQGVVGGIGFLGAGVIIQARGEVKGLTTAAGLWVMAAIGLAIGLGAYLIATIAIALSLVALAVLHAIEGSGSAQP